MPTITLEYTVIDFDLIIINQQELFMNELWTKLTNL